MMHKLWKSFIFGKPLLEGDKIYGRKEEFSRIGLVRYSTVFSGRNLFQKEPNK